MANHTKPSLGPVFRPSLIPDFPRAEIVICLIYLILGCAWIIFSDRVLDLWNNDPADTLPLQTYKGINFILTSAGIWYLVLRHFYNRRRLAEAEAQAALERFELVARVATDAIFDWNMVTDTVYWSEGLHNVFGHPVVHSGTSMEVWTQRVHPDDRVRLTANLNAARDGGRNYATDEFRFQRNDGSYADVAIRAQLLRDASGRVTRLVGGLRDITQRKQAQEELALSRHRLRALSAKLESLREEERSRISREIHDQLGQMLTGLKMDLRWIERRLGDLDGSAAINPILDKAVEAAALTDETIVAVQKIAAELRPGVLDNLGLPAAIRCESIRFQERTGITCNVKVPEQPMPLAREVATASFRIFQETLTNVTRHADAKRVDIDLRLDGNDFVLEIADNGKGIGADTLLNPRSLGLLGMQERAANINGKLTIQRGEPAGTRVTLRAAQDTHDTRIWEQL